VIEFLGQVQEPYRAALSLFYLEDYSYKEIADILEVPLGTVRSRISRGLAQLQELIHIGTGTTSLRMTRACSGGPTELCATNSSTNTPIGPGKAGTSPE